MAVTTTTGAVTASRTVPNVLDASLKRMESERHYMNLCSELEYAKQKLHISSSVLEVAINKLEVFEWNLANFKR